MDKLIHLLNSIKSEIQDPYELAYFIRHRYRYHYILKKIDHLNLPKNARILDVGCYPLHMFTMMSRQGFAVCGISSKHEPVHHTSIKTVNIESGKMPFRNKFFDLILFSEVMEHLVINPLVYLSEFRRVLKKNGRLIVTTPNAAGLHKIFPLLFGRSTYFPLEDLYKTGFKDDTIYYRHNREYTMSELHEIMNKAKFKIIHNYFFEAYQSYRHVEVGGQPVRAVFRLFSWYVAKVIPRLRDTLYIGAGYEEPWTN